MVTKPKTIRARIERLETPENALNITAIKLGGIVSIKNAAGVWIETPEKDYKDPPGVKVIKLDWGDDDQ